jgi:colicin import membrane protein
MAEPIVRSFVIDTSESEQNLKELNVQINATDAAINQGAQAFDNVAVAQDEVVASSKSLKAQLRELQAQIANTEPNSAKYRELSQAAGELKDRIADAAEAVGSQAGSAFERVSGSLGLVTGRLANLDFAGAAEGAKLFATNLTAVKPAELANGLKNVGSTITSVGKALLTNPLFLLGGAVVLIITNLDKLANVIPGVGAALEAIGNVVSFIVDGVKSLSDAILGTEFVANDALNKSLEQRDKFIKELDQQEKRAIANAKKNGESVTAVEEKYAQERIKTYQNIIDEAAYLTSQGVKLTEDQIKGVEEANAALFDIETQQIQKAAELAEKARQEEERKQQEAAAKRKQNAEKRAAEEKARKEKELDEQRKALETYYNGIAALEDEQFEKTLNQNEKEELAITKKYENLFAAADAAGKDTKDLQARLNAELLALQQKQAQDEIAKEAEKERLKAEARIKASEDYYAKLAELQDAEFENTLTAFEKEELAINQKYEALFAAADAAGISTLELQKKQAEELAAVQKKAADDAVNTVLEEEAKKTAARQESFQKGLDLAQSAIQILQAFSDASTKNSERDARRKFKTDKALAIGAATVQTASAVTGALTAGGNPIKLATGQQFVEASIAAALGLAQIIKIKNSQFGGGATGGNDITPSVPSTGSEGGGAQPAQFNPLAASFLQDRPEQITPRAYVLAGDVASAQEVRENVADLARIG